MNERFNSRVGEYRDQAAKLRVLAYETRFAESRSKLLMLADSFEKLGTGGSAGKLLRDGCRLISPTDLS